jgi:UDP-N-acetylmuramate dehydrogenase
MSAFKFDREKFKDLKGSVRFNVPLKDYVYYGIGGPADIFVEPKNDLEIQQAVEIFVREKIPFFILGSGTNLLVREGGIRGAVLYLGAGLPGTYQVLSRSGGSVSVRVPAHWPKAKLLSLSLEQGWGGLEFSAGIPGTLGGAVWMNAGTKWGSYSEVIDRVKFFSPTRGFFEKSKAEMNFKYRGHGEGLIDSQTVIVSVDLLLVESVDSAGSRNLVDEILGYRGSKQPLELRNCGSVFKNPEKSERGAGRLIEAAALKGTRIGDAMISLKHANFILNLGNAKSSDVESLIELCKKEVKQKFSIDLEPEVIVVGDV